MRPFVLALCVLSATAAFAQETRYRLERIVVEGSNVAEEIVRAESRLDEEKSYTEEDFRQALYRVRRLPFVADATYRLEPGVTAGGTTVVMRILGTTAVYYELNGGALRDSEGETQRDGSALLGGRALLDNLGVLEGAIRKEDGGDGLDIGVAYRAYDIMGTGAFATALVAKRIRAKERDYDITPVLTLGWPLTQKQTLTLVASKAKSRVSRSFDVNGDDNPDDDSETDLDDNVDLTNRDKVSFAELRWWYESIDDPFFATRGASLSAGPRWSQGEFSVQNYDATTKKVVSTDTNAESYGLAVDASAYRSLVGRSVGFIRLSGVGTRDSDTDVDVLDGSANVGVAFDFHSHAENTIRPVKARLELGAGYRTFRVSAPGLDTVSTNDPLAQAAFVMRHRWGTIRLTGTYLAD